MKKDVNEERKREHVDVCLSEDVQSSYNYWGDIRLVHQALPEIDMDDIDLTTKIFGVELNAPIIITAITGGYKRAGDINHNLAEAASRVGIGLGVGSQRAAIEDEGLAGTYEVIKDFDVPLVIANLGAPQLVPQKEKKGFSLVNAERAMEMIDADLLAIHLNYLQEVVQHGGDTNAHGCLEEMRKIALRLPVIAKETGAGLSKDVGLRLKKIGVKGIDIGGMGGTSFAAVEYYRAKKIGDKKGERLGKTFWDWGIPTPVSVIQVDVDLPIIATGGIRNGLDVARAIAIGASSSGISHPFLRLATKGVEAVVEELEIIIGELKAAMFLTSSSSIHELGEKEVIVTGPTREWLE